MAVKVIEESVLHNGFVMRDEAGRVTHRFERSTYGDKILLRNVRTGLAEITASDLF